MELIAEQLAAVPASAAAIDTKVGLIQELIPLGLLHVQESLQQEVERLAGPRYARQGGRPGVVRYGKQPGSIYLADQKLGIDVPRMRNLRRNREVPLRTYHQLQHPRAADHGVVQRILTGLTCREYERCAEAVPEAFGLSSSTVSRRFIRASRVRGHKHLPALRRALQAHKQEMEAERAGKSKRKKAA